MNCQPGHGEGHLCIQAGMDRAKEPGHEGSPMTGREGASLKCHLGHGLRWDPGQSQASPSGSLQEALRVACAERCPGGLTPCHSGGERRVHGDPPAHSGLRLSGGPGAAHAGLVSSASWMSVCLSPQLYKLLA